MYIHIELNMLTVMYMYYLHIHNNVNLLWAEFEI